MSPSDAPITADAATTLNWRRAMAFQVGFWSAVYIYRMLMSWAFGYGLEIIPLSRIVSVALSVLMTTGLFAALERLRSRSHALRLSVGTLATMVLGFAHTVIDRAIWRSLAEGHLAFAGRDEFLQILSVNLWVFVTWYGFYAAIDHIDRLSWRERELASADAQMRAAQLQMLRYQLNPHFLFNTLNAVSALILDGRAADAERTLGQLTRFLRVTVYDHPDHQLSVREEMELARAFLDIEQTRYLERLRVEIEIDEAAEELRVPSLILQPLVENAVKHGVANRPDGGRLVLSARLSEGALVLAVEDDGPGGPGAADIDLAAREGRGVGVANTRARLAALFGAHARLTLSRSALGGVRAAIRMPAPAAGPEPAPPRRQRLAKPATA